jgi:hypothetical protein
MKWTASITDGTSTAEGTVIYVPCPAGQTATATISIKTIGFESYTVYVQATVINPVTYDLAGSTGTFMTNGYQSFYLPPGLSTLTLSRTGADIVAVGVPLGDPSWNAFKQRMSDELGP